MGTLERPALNLNKEDEVKHCSKTGNQQDMAHRRYITFPLDLDLSLLSLSLSPHLTVFLSICTFLASHSHILSFPFLSKPESFFLYLAPPSDLERGVKCLLRLLSHLSVCFAQL